MKTLKFDSREEWLEARLGKITGSRLKDVLTKRGTAKKLAYYELIAERIAIPDEADADESPMDRGTRLEAEALEQFAKETGKEVDASLAIWTRDDNESIAISPDGIIGKTEAVETKCLSSALHVKTFLTQAVPSDYEDQTVQYFIVNDKLKTLYVAFYDPRVPVKEFFYLTIKRKDVEAKIEEYLSAQRTIIDEVEAEVNKLTF